MRTTDNKLKVTKMIIKHQQQPTSDTCASTCIAMLLGVPVNDVISKFHDKYKAGEMNIDHYLKNNGLAVEPILSNYWQAQWGKLYLLAVPSLNSKANLHSIILDCRLEGIVDIYDPNMGKKDKDYYVLVGKENKTVHEHGLISYMVELIIHV